MNFSPLTFEISKVSNNIIKFSHRYNNNFTNSLILSNLKNKLQENIFNIFSNMTNLYDYPSAVLCFILPYCESYPSANKQVLNMIIVLIYYLQKMI